MQCVSTADWKDANECYDCRVQFSILTRKHHCRICGDVFCDRCTRQRVDITGQTELRACDACYSRHINPVLEEEDISEEEALVSLFASLGGSGWRERAGWSAELPQPRHGVTADEQGNVSMLVLNKNNLTGCLPENIKYLKKLTKLSVSNNLISGSICKGIGDLTNLVCLQLSGNRMTGRIPGSISNCQALQRLDLSQNLFYGSVPKELCSLVELMWLKLDNNEITDLPENIGDLVKLKSLTLHNNPLRVGRRDLVSKMPKDCTIQTNDDSECVVA